MRTTCKGQQLNIFFPHTLNSTNISCHVEGQKLEVSFWIGFYKFQPLS